MKTDKKKGKRGRPRKHPIVEKIKSDIKRGRGRPPKTPKIEGLENINYTKDLLYGEDTGKKGRGMSTWILTHPEEYNEMCKADKERLEEYKEPILHRKIRVFRFDRSIFHSFAKKFNGDIITMSYIVDTLMIKYLDKKIKINPINKTLKYYQEWCKGSPPLEPVGSNDLAQASAVSRGIPLQYKYSLIIDEATYNKFQSNNDYYPQFLINILVKMYLNEEIKINIDTKKVYGWCNFG